MASDGLRTRSSRHQLPVGTARIVAIAGLVGALALPIVIWHHAIGAVASDFRFDLRYLVTGWSAFALIGIALVMAVPVVWSIGRDPEGRFYPRKRNAYAGWSASLYVLGMALASQVDQIVGH